MHARIRPSVTLTLVLLTSALCGLPRAARAQTPDQGSTARLEDLKRKLDDLERTLAVEIAAVRQQILVLEAQARPASSRAAVASTSAQVPAADETFSRDRETVAAVDNRPLDPTLQGFIPIPGTPSRVKVDGYAKLDTNIDGKPAGNPDRFMPSTIPVGLSDAQQTASSTMHAARPNWAPTSGRSPRSISSGRVPRWILG